MGTSGRNTTPLIGVAKRYDVLEAELHVAIAQRNLARNHRAEAERDAFAKHLAANQLTIELSQIRAALAASRRGGKAAMVLAALGWAALLAALTSLWRVL